MPEGEVMRQYQVLPAIEQTKIMIIGKLNLMFDIINKIMQDKMIGRKDDEVIGLLKSTILSTYILLKPKIYEHVQVKERMPPKENDIMRTEDLRQLFKLDSYILNPSDFRVEDAMMYADLINGFCHEYGITKITYFSGTQQTGTGGINTI